MTSENKRKTRSASPPTTTPLKRRASVRNTRSKTPPNAVQQPPPRPSVVVPSLPVPKFLEGRPRPKRWRKSVSTMNDVRLLYHVTNLASKHAEGRKPNLGTIAEEPLSQQDSVQHGYTLHSGSQKKEQAQDAFVTLRFSFSQAADEEDANQVNRPRRNIFREAQEARARAEEASPDMMNESFSYLSFKQDDGSTRENSPEETILAHENRAEDANVTVAKPSRVPPIANSKAKLIENWAQDTLARRRSTAQADEFAPTPAPAPAAVPAPPRGPTAVEMSKPKAKREGYGFSFSDSLFYDSDEYPDTDGGGGGTEPGASDAGPSSFSTVAHDDDVVVVRDVGSFPIARPQRRLACTPATREDTIKLKAQAKTLMKFNESHDIYAALVTRLERMLCRRRASSQDGIGMAMLVCAALQLRNVLAKAVKERLHTGEARRVVEHEMEWAAWLVEASSTGVMHVKGVGCRCEADWEG
ncbi:hypothetical protein ACEQ8H_000363 [Pleosporales sp. CAS-2024a]